MHVRAACGLRIREPNGPKGPETYDEFFPVLAWRLPFKSQLQEAVPPKSHNKRFLATLGLLSRAPLACRVAYEFSKYDCYFIRLDSS